MNVKITLTRTVMTLCLALFCFWGIKAEDVTPELALEQAQSFLSNRQTTAGGPRRTPGVAPQLKLQGKVNGLYVFNVENDGGFVIVSNDDRTIPILGFSDSGSLDPSNMPSNMKAWLQGYADEIAWLAEHGQTIITSRKARQKVGSHSTHAIAPLIRTTWNQNVPYKNLCPEYDDPYYGSGTCATGCVATAMAQVMKYHEWPTAATEAIPGYTTSRYGMEMPSLPSTTFDWANMKDNYSGSYTTAEGNAVATLMQYCGYSVQMNYGPESGSTTDKVAEALKTYFDYNNETTQFVMRSFYTSGNWADMIYHELANGRPVVYGGSSSGGGHEFVCDGYIYQNGTDFFHINWGWGGQSDDYFVLSSLNPYAQGIGGSSSDDGFHYGQDAVIGIQKSTENGTTANVSKTYVNLTINSITPTRRSVPVNTSVSIIINITNNNTTDEYSGDVWLGGKDGGYYLIEGSDVNIPAGETKDCSITITPYELGTLNLVWFLPDESGSYYTNGQVMATLEVFESTTNEYVPIYGWYCDALVSSQFVIPASDCQHLLGNYVTGMTFYAKQETVTWGSAEFDVYLKEVNETTISSLEDWDAMKKVYSGSLSINSYEMTFAFDDAYKYNGGNLLVGFRQTQTGAYEMCEWIGMDAPGASMGGTSGDFDQRNFLPSVNFDFNDGSELAAPADLKAENITANTADITWADNPDADSYELQYTEGLIANAWYRYDTGIWNTSVGWSGGELSWAVMFPAGTYVGDLVKTVSIFDGNEMTGTVAIYNDNDEPDVSASAIATKPVTLTGSHDFVEISFDSLPIDSTKNVWVVVNKESGDDYPIACSTNAPDDANSRWFYYNGWTELPMSGVEGLAFMVRAEIGTAYDAATATWETVTDATSPCQLTELEPETYYTVRAKAIYRKSGESMWTTTFFKTMEGDVVPPSEPYGIMADLFATGAILTWDGSAKAYNVRYRTAGNINEDPGEWEQMYVTDKTATIDGLATNKLYEYEVQSVKGSLTSEWSCWGEFALVTLANDADNSSMIDDLDGKLAHVTLADRTLYKDNSWNTIYLPFDMTVEEFAASPLAEGDIRRLLSVSVSGETFMLNFSQKGADLSSWGYWGGYPYIIKWESGSDIVNPEFANVIITRGRYGSGNNKVMFYGTYAPMSFTAEDKSILFIGADDKLYWPLAGAKIGAQRGYFRLTGVTAGTKEFVMDFGEDDPTSISEISENSEDSDWYDLSGRKLAEKPAMKGIFIVNGKKVLK